ncbi:MAG: UbiA family prenyltransferase [Clostridiales bacterium]|jgi:1,4-dihydroxy-2-naphthoate octaprenyltransferase|nr:UbiA family prenyltransferase [Clostridiales bacterium]
MNTFTRFLKFIEITTKLASLVPFFIGVAYVFYKTGTINAGHTALLLLDVMLFDLPVTMINNYLDKRRSGEPPHFGKAFSLSLIIIMVALSFAIGIWFTVNYGLVTLAVGGLCFFVGIFYSATPICLNRTPYGEIFSGLTQGFCITFLVAFINMPAGYFATLALNGVSLKGNINMVTVGEIMIVTLPAVFCISNIMLANNICDVERDAKTDRYTLPYYIGHKSSLALYSAIYGAAYAAIVVGVLLRALPWTCLLLLLTIPPIKKNVIRFVEKPQKAVTFVLSINNFNTILLCYIVLLILGRFLRFS